MSAVTRDTFGPLVAYLVPGATVLWGISLFSTDLHIWFVLRAPDAPALGGFLYLTVASLATGMVVNAVRWAVVDSLHYFCKVSLPNLDFSRLGDRVEAFNLLISIHYQHYQFYANSLIATAFAYVCYRIRLGTVWPLGLTDFSVLLLEVIFFVTSRDTLKKYYSRSHQLLKASNVDR